jgi:hypothetical protein
MAFNCRTDNAVYQCCAATGANCDDNAAAVPIALASGESTQLSGTMYRAGKPPGAEGEHKKYETGLYCGGARCQLDTSPAYLPRASRLDKLRKNRANAYFFMPIANNSHIFDRNETETNVLKHINYEVSGNRMLLNGQRILIGEVDSTQPYPFFLYIETHPAWVGFLAEKGQTYYPNEMNVDPQLARRRTIFSKLIRFGWVSERHIFFSPNFIENSTHTK